MDIDIIILLFFLSLSLYFGIKSGKNISSITDFALGGRNFSTAAIICTLVATKMSGSALFTRITEIYKHGMYFIIGSTVGTSVSLLLVAIFFAPRMKRFLGCLSIAEAMGGLYDEKVRLLTAIVGCVGTTGIIAAQFKAMGVIFHYCFDIDPIYCVLLGSLIVIIYSSFGGVKSVTFTDIIQLFTFCTILPTLMFFIFGSLNHNDALLQIFYDKEFFDIQNMFDFYNTKTQLCLTLLLYLSIPAFDPTYFQRISMAKDLAQVIRSHKLASLVIFILGVVIAFIGMIVYAAYPNASTTDLVRIIISDYSYVGLKGLTLAAIMAMAMSTADSYINSISILVSYDIFHRVKLSLTSRLLLSRITSLLLGLISLYLALMQYNFFEIIIITTSYYIPTVSLPFILSVFNVKLNSNAVFVGMLASLIVVTLFQLGFFGDNRLGSLIPALSINLLILLVGKKFQLK